MTFSDSVDLSSPKLIAHLTISRDYWDECEELGLSPVGARPVLVIDSNNLLPDLLLKVFPFRGFNSSEVMI